jgi:HAD superfamily hydrolase (TIGR01509 family)
MQAAIFDFDGTIADSCYVWDAVDKHFFESRGMEIPTDYISKISTLNMYDGAVFTKTAYGFSDSIESIMDEWLNGALTEYEQNVTLKPFAAEYINKLKNEGIKIGLVTSASPEFYTPVLKKSGIYDLFDTFVDGSLGVRSKDFPDMFIHCAKLLDTPPEHCCVYEDILPAILSAKSADMYTTAVYEPKSHRDSSLIKQTADKYIMSFSELM